jgi:hypothetical protein
MKEIAFFMVAYEEIGINLSLCEGQRAAWPPGDTRAVRF